MPLLITDFANGMDKERMVTRISFVCLGLAGNASIRLDRDAAPLARSQPF
jgi:hypothetical protein